MDKPNSVSVLFTKHVVSRADNKVEQTMHVFSSRIVF
jgi:hypothetical protein